MVTAASPEPASVSTLTDYRDSLQVALTIPPLGYDLPEQPRTPPSVAWHLVDADGSPIGLPRFDQQETIALKDTDFPASEAGTTGRHAGSYTLVATVRDVHLLPESAGGIEVIRNPELFPLFEEQYTWTINLDLATRTATETTEVVPGGFMLTGSYPNPFTVGTTVAFEVARPATLTLAAYDLTGRYVATLFAARAFTPGPYTETWEAAHLPSGLYLLRLQDDTSGTTRQVHALLVK